MHVRRQNQTSRGDRPKQVVQPGFVRARQFGVILGPEILDDDFLDVAVRRM